MSTQTSQCPVIRNISQHLILPTSYPLSPKYFTSLPSVAKSQLTYTTFFDPIFRIVSRQTSRIPFLSDPQRSHPHKPYPSHTAAAALPLPFHWKTLHSQIRSIWHSLLHPRLGFQRGLTILFSISVHKALASLDKSNRLGPPGRRHFNPQGSREPRPIHLNYLI